MPNAWDRQDGEKAVWYKRFLSFRDLGADRKLIHAVNIDRTIALENTPGAWKDAFERDNWKQRAEAWDAMLYAEKQAAEAKLRAAEEAEIERVLTEDYAAKHERVRALANMAHIVEQSFIDEKTKTVKYQFMSADKLREWRGILDDIAKEVGHRIKETRLTGRDGGKIEIDTIWGGGAVDE